MPAAVRWPGVIKPHTRDQRHLRLRGLGADADGGGRRARHQRTSCSSGYDAGGKTFKVHLDGYDQHDLLAGGAGQAPRVLLLDRRRRPRRLCATTSGRSSSSSSRRRHSRLAASRSFRCGAPLLFNLRTDPFERADQRVGRIREDGTSSACSSWRRRRRSSGENSRPSRTSRRARSPAASRSATRWRSSSTRGTAATECACRCANCERCRSSSDAHRDRCPRDRRQRVGRLPGPRKPDVSRAAERLRSALSGSGVQRRHRANDGGIRSRIFLSR